MMAILSWIAYSYLSTHVASSIAGFPAIAAVILGLLWSCDGDVHSPLEHSKVDTQNAHRVVNMQINYLDYSPRALILSFMMPVAVICVSIQGSS